MSRYRKRPVIIEAVQFSGNNHKEILEFMGKKAVVFNYEALERQELEIATLEGIMTASVNDFIIKGVQGEFYPCKPDIFELTYEKEEE